MGIRAFALTVSGFALLGQLQVFTAMKSELGWHDLIILLLLALVQALALVLFVLEAKSEFSEDVLRESFEEEEAEVGQTSRVPSIRGRSIGKQIRASRDRMRIFVRTVIFSVLPLIAVAVCVLALVLILIFGYV